MNSFMGPSGLWLKFGRLAQKCDGWDSVVTARALTTLIAFPFGRDTTATTEPPTTILQATGTTVPVATDSGDEAMPDEDQARVEERLKTPEQTTVPLPPSTAKRPALVPVPRAPAT